MTRILLGKGLPRSTALLLGAAGWDAVHGQDVGLSTSSDTAIADSAGMNRQVICTLDADLHALLAVSGSDTPSVMRARCEGLRGPDVVGLLLASAGDNARGPIGRNDHDHRNGQSHSPVAHRPTAARKIVIVLPALAGALEI